MRHHIRRIPHPVVAGDHRPPQCSTDEEVCHNRWCQSPVRTCCVTVLACQEGLAETPPSVDADLDRCQLSGAWSRCESCRRKRPGAATEAQEISEFLHLLHCCWSMRIYFKCDREGCNTVISISAGNSLVQAPSCFPGHDAAMRSIVPSIVSRAQCTDSSRQLERPLIEGHASQSLLRDVRASTSAMSRNGRALSLPSASAAWATAADDRRAAVPTSSLKCLRPMPPYLCGSWTCTFCNSVSSNPDTPRTRLHARPFPPVVLEQQETTTWCCAASAPRRVAGNRAARSFSSKGERQS